jgi:hypothetical protein
MNVMCWHLFPKTSKGFVNLIRNQTQVGARTERGKWRVASGKWEVEGGKREVGSEKWRVASGKWELVSGK